VARLVERGVVAERRVRGALERIYIMRAAAARISADEVAKMSVDEHRQAFLAFIAGLIRTPSVISPAQTSIRSVTGRATTWPACGSTTSN
jgi:hypothetical protein